MLRQDIFDPLLVRLFFVGCFVHAMLTFSGWCLLKGSQIMKVVVKVKCEPAGPTVAQIETIFRRMSLGDVFQDEPGPFTQFHQLLEKVVQEAFDAGREHERKHPCSESER